MASDPGEITALLGHGTDFAGKLTFEGTVRIDGRFHGEIFTAHTLIIGEGAEVQAEIEAGTLIIKGGTVVGNVRARELVELHAPGRLFGNIESPSLFIGRGVQFDGRCQMRTAEDGEDGTCEPIDGPAAPYVETEPVPPGSAPAAASGPPPTPSAAATSSAPPPPFQAWPPVQILPSVPGQKRR
ncbi:MAG: polymer-forming cytoskeletal protein [Deltaproteobacteria bacterium]|nr:polymer-forming cytoskeletal protein [Deltaproteobacteria bacterium]